MLELKGDFPQKNETLEYQQFLFTVEAADRRRILKVKVVINQDNEE